MCGKWFKCDHSAFARIWYYFVLSDIYGTYKFPIKLFTTGSGCGILCVGNEPMKDENS